MTIEVVPVDNRLASTVDNLDGKPTLEWLQAQVGGNIEVKELRNGSQLVMNEEGRLLSYSINHHATELYRLYGLPEHWSRYECSYTLIVGPVVILTGKHRMQ